VLHRSRLYIAGVVLSLWFTLVSTEAFYQLCQCTPPAQVKIASIPVPLLSTRRGRRLPECQPSLSGGQDHQPNFSIFCFRRDHHRYGLASISSARYCWGLRFSFLSLADLVSTDSAVASETQRPVLKAVFGYTTTSLIQTNRNKYNFSTTAAVKWCIKRSITAAELEFSGVSRKRSILLIEVLRSVLGTVRWRCNVDSADEL
jgi:hypothetical protein